MVRFVLPDCRRGRGSPSLNKRLLTCICDDQGCRSVSGPSLCLNKSHAEKRGRLLSQREIALHSPSSAARPPPPGRATRLQSNEVTAFLIGGLKQRQKTCQGCHASSPAPKQTRKPPAPQSSRGRDLRAAAVMKTDGKRRCGFRRFRCGIRIW